MTVSKHWCNPDMIDTTELEDHMNLMFANHGVEEDISSYYNYRDSKSTTERSTIDDLLQKRCYDMKQRF